MLRVNNTATHPGRCKTLYLSLMVTDGFFGRLLNMLVTMRWMKNSRLFIQSVGRAPRYVGPKNWTDKMQWRKVFDRNPLFRTFTDKVAVRNYVQSVSPDVRFPEFYWVGDQIDDIPFADFTAPYVLKPAIGSGDYYMVENPRQVDAGSLRKKCDQWLRRKSYGLSLAEWGYWGKANRILIEEYLPALVGEEGISNWKFFVFSGVVGLVQLESKRLGKSHLTFFDRDGHRLAVKKWVGRLGHTDSMDKPDLDAQVPQGFHRLVEDAEKLGGGLDHVRVDLYDLNGETWFSELTPYDGSGHSYLYDEDADTDIDGIPADNWDARIGSLWDLPDISLWEKSRSLLSRKGV